MFDQVYRAKYQYIQYQINIIIFIMKYIFMFYLIGIVDVDIISYKFVQT